MAASTLDRVEGDARALETDVDLAIWRLVPKVNAFGIDRKWQITSEDGGMRPFTCGCNCVL